MGTDPRNRLSTYAKGLEKGASRTRPARTVAVGDVVADRYKVTGNIGRGGMGSVFRAEDLHLGRSVALKLLAQDLADTERLRTRFLEEARAMGGLRHEHVAQVYSYGTDSGEPYIVMEYVRGATVADAIYGRSGTSRGLAADYAVGVIDQTAKGLAAIHAAGIIHGDIKPTNVLLDERQRAVVVDFGLMRWLGDLEDMSIVVGTPAYIPPEVVKADSIELRLTPAADVFALGVMAYEMFTGRLPFQVSNVDELFDVHLRNVKAPRLSSLRPDVSPLYDEVFERVLSDDLRSRYRSADEFRRALLAVRAAASAPDGPFGVVVADSDREFCARASVALEGSVQGASAAIAHTAGQLVELVRRGAVDLVVVDFKLPGMGFRLLFENLLDVLDSPRRVVVVGDVSADDAAQLRQLGIAATLPRPVDVTTLESVVRFLSGR